MRTPDQDLEQYEREQEQADELENYQDFISDLEDLTTSLTNLSISAPTALLKKAIDEMKARTCGLIDIASEYIEGHGE